jgi:HEAT repeats
MYFTIPQPFFRIPRSRIFALTLLLLFAGKTLATITTQPSNSPMTRLVMSENMGSELQLEARQIPLASVLDMIANKTHVPIHYSALPEGLVTATCVGTTLKQVLDCLLNGRADIIFRYPNNLTKAQIAEAWVLGSKLDGIAAKDCPTLSSVEDKNSLSFAQSLQNRESELDDHMKVLLNMAQSGNTEERARAISALLSAGYENNPEVKATLEQALNDQDASVRAQAISTYAHREGGTATEAIQQALQDSSVDVRLMAVDGITEDIDLLEQATNDNNEAVRNLAAMKLAELNANTIK